ncbi:MAG: sel1 repeat family protein [Helicobacteraceae bacterium]|nr:sel1 repeat family protein [Helicobacteraceae bacterium]
MEYYTKACDLRVSFCDHIAEIYWDGKCGIPKDMIKAVEYYKRYCNSKYEDLETCQKVGDAYAKGDGVPKDYKIALEYYNKACKHDRYGGICLRAQILDAILDGDGDSCTISVLEKSCNIRRNSTACSLLAGMYWKGKGLSEDFIPSEKAPKDLDKAHEYFVKACAIEKNVLDCHYVNTTLEEKKALEANATTNQADRNSTANGYNDAR